MKEMPLVSIIIPFYNTPQELFKKCIDSIIKQNYKNIEIIIVNDGSSKEAFDKLEKVVNNLSNIKVISQLNMGVSAARNNGISEANGDFVLFVDSDDQLALGWIRFSINLALKNNVDIVAGKVLQISENSQVEEFSDDYQYSVICKDDYWKLQRDFLYFTTEFVENMGDLDPGMHGKLIKADCIHDLKFPEGIKLSEDQVFNHEMTMHTKRYILTNRTAYYYIFNGESASHIYQPLAAEHMMKSMQLIKETLIDNKSVTQAFYYRVVAELLNAVQFSLFSNKKRLTYQDRIAGLKEDCKYDLVVEALNNLDYNALPSRLWKMKCILLKDKQYHLFVALKMFTDYIEKK